MQGIGLVIGAGRRGGVCRPRDRLAVRGVGAAFACFAADPDRAVPDLRRGEKINRQDFAGAIAQTACPARRFGKRVPCSF